MRIISGMMLATMLGLAAGCGGKADAPAEAKSEPTTTPVGTAAPVDPGNKGVIPAVVPATWELDPAKHFVPTGPVTGKVQGEMQSLDVQAEKDSLRFRIITKAGPVLAFEVHLSDPTKSIEGMSATVKPDQKADLTIPILIVRNPHKVEEEPKIMNDGYAMTLSLGKREKGAIGGKIHLSLPGEAKTFIAGTFSAEWLRPREELPGADDAPFIQGKIVVKGVAEPQVDVGYLRVDPAEPTHSDVLGIGIGPSGFPFRSETNRPRCISLFPATAKEAARYELTKLEPGRYCVIVSNKTGPAAWKWIDVAAGGQVAVDFTLDVAALGSLDVAAPNGSKSVSVVPAAETGKPWPETLIATAASMMELRIDTAETSKADPTKPLTLKFPRLAPGKYEVWADDLKMDVEIKANEAAKVELKKK